MQRPVSSPYFASRHHNFIIDEQLGEGIEPVWWECLPAGNGLDPVSQRLTSFLEVFAFFDPEYVNIIGGPWCSIRLKQQLSAVSSSKNAVVTTPDQSGPRLQERWLVIARAAWIVLALLLLANFSASISATYGQLGTICTNSTFGHCIIWQPTPANMQALHHLGLSLDTYAAYTLTIDVLASLVFLAVGCPDFLAQV